MNDCVFPSASDGRVVIDAAVFERMLQRIEDDAVRIVRLQHSGGGASQPPSYETTKAVSDISGPVSSPPQIMAPPSSALPSMKSRSEVQTISPRRTTYLSTHRAQVGSSINWPPSTAPPTTTYSPSTAAVGMRDDLHVAQQQKIFELTGVIAGLESEAQKDKSSLAELRKDLLAAKQAILDAEHMASREREAAATARGALVQAAAREEDRVQFAAIMDRHLADKDSLIHALEAEVRQVKEHEMQVLRRGLSVVQADVDRLARDASQSETAKQTEVAVLEEHLQMKQQQVSALEETLRSREETLTSLTRQGEAVERRASEAEREVEKLSEEVGRSHKELSRLRQEVSDASCREEKLWQQQSAVTERLASADKDLRDRAVELQRSTEDVLKMETTLKLLHGDLHRLRAVETELRTDIDQRIEREAKLKLELEEARRCLDDAVHSRDTTNTDAAKSKEELRRAYELIDTMRRERQEHLGTGAGGGGGGGAGNGKGTTNGGAAAGTEMILLQERLSAATFTKDILTREVNILRKQLEASNHELEMTRASLANRVASDATMGLFRTTTGTSRSDAAALAESSAAVKALREENEALRREMKRVCAEWDRSRDEILTLQRRNVR